MFWRIVVFKCFGAVFLSVMLFFSVFCFKSFFCDVFCFFFFVISVLKVAGNRPNTEQPFRRRIPRRLGDRKPAAAAMSSWRTEFLPLRHCLTNSSSSSCSSCSTHWQAIPNASTPPSRLLQGRKLARLDSDRTGFRA